MAVKNKVALQAQVDALFADNSSADISPQDVRTVHTDAVDSFVDVGDVDYLHLQDLTSFTSITPTGSDAGLIINGQLEVGTIAAPRESIFGEGDSTVDDMIVFQTSDDIVYIDRTTVLSVDDGSTVGLFNGTAIGLITYIGGDHPLEGIKIKTDVIGAIDHDNVIIEYWGGSAWIEDKLMATDANFPFTQRGYHACEIVGSDQWRFGGNHVGLSSDIATRAVNGITKYWYKITTIDTLSVDPLIDQIKLHTNSFEINSNGFTEYFGNSRYKKIVLSGVDNLINNTAHSPASQSVEYTPEVIAGYTDNELQNNATDSAVFPLNIDEGLDTSIPVEINISYYVEGTNTGDIEFNLRTLYITDGFVYDGSAASVDEFTLIDTVSSDSNLVRRTGTMYVDASYAHPNTAILVIIARDGTAGNISDTLAANVVLTHVVVNGFFWKP